MDYRNSSSKQLLSLAEELTQEEIHDLPDPEYLELETHLRKVLAEIPDQLQPRQRRALEEFLAWVEFDWLTEGGGRRDRIRMEEEWERVINHD